MREQAVLDLISSSFSSTLSSPRFGENLQTVKTHLYNRSFSEAFPTSKPEDDAVDNEAQVLLETYVLRWVPTRVLCYARIFERIASFLPEELQALCIGGGCGSESLAFQVALNRPRILLKQKVADSSESTCHRLMCGMGTYSFQAYRVGERRIESNYCRVPSR